MHAYFGQEAAQKLSWTTYFNAGVFALKQGAPHWARWRHAFHSGLQVAEGHICCDQTALNHMLWTEKLPISPMPATCNWLCHLALPSYDVASSQFREPTTPSSPLGILHLAADSKDIRIQTRVAHQVREIGLRFPATD